MEDYINTTKLTTDQNSGDGECFVCHGMINTISSFVFFNSSKIEFIKTVPSSNFGLKVTNIFMSKNLTRSYQSRHLQLHQIHSKLSSQTRCIKLDLTTETNELHHLHVVDQRVAMSPGHGAGTIQRLLTNLLN